MEKRTKKFVLAGVLGAVSVILSLTPLGLIPVPNLALRYYHAHTCYNRGIIGGGGGGFSGIDFSIFHSPPVCR